MYNYKIALQLLVLRSRLYCNVWEQAIVVNEPDSI